MGCIQDRCDELQQLVWTDPGRVDAKLREPLRDGNRAMIGADCHDVAVRPNVLV